MAYGGKIPLRKNSHRHTHTHTHTEPHNHYYINTVELKCGMQLHVECHNFLLKEAKYNYNIYIIYYIHIYSIYIDALT